MRGEQIVKATMRHLERSTSSIGRHRADPGAAVRPSRRWTAWLALPVAGAMAVGVLVAAAPAQAKSSVVSDGSCKASPGSTWKVKVQQEENGSLTVIASVFSEDTDEWSWKLKHNDDVSAKGTVTARDADRSFRITRSMINFGGADEVTFRAGNKDSDEVCRGDVTFYG